MRQETALDMIQVDPEGRRSIQEEVTIDRHTGIATILRGLHMVVLVVGTTQQGPTNALMTVRSSVRAHVGRKLLAVLVIDLLHRTVAITTMAGRHQLIHLWRKVPAALKTNPGAMTMNGARRCQPRRQEAPVAADNNSWRKHQV